MATLDEMIPVQIVFDDGLKLATVGIVISTRSDGCHEILFPQATCILTKGGHPRNAWPKTTEPMVEAREFSPQASKELKVSRPLMPRRQTRGRRTDQRDGPALPGH